MKIDQIIIRIKSKEILPIDEKINYYNILLGRVDGGLTKRQKRVLRRPHMKKKYLEEIAKLEEQKNIILSTEPTYIVVNFDAVRFENHQIRITMPDGKISQPFSLRESRQSFEFIKKFIERCSIEPLKVLSLGDQIIAIQNLQELHSVIKVLTVQDLMYENNRFSADNILEIMKTLDNNFIMRYFVMKEKSSYFEYLCNSQCLEYKIIPVIETGSSEKKDNHNDGFLFTVSVNTEISYIIWESVSINRATYLFQSTSQNYVNCIQKIFDFISSNQQAKRIKIRNLIKKPENVLNVVKFIEHNNFESWKNNIELLIKPH